MDKQKRKALTLKEKYDIIQKVQSGVKQSDFCRELSLPKSTVSITWKKRNDILIFYGSQMLRARK